MPSAKSSALSGYVGQQDRLGALRAALRANEKGKPLPNMLFLGNSGSGKTRLATEVAKATKNELVIAHAPSIQDRTFLAEKIIAADGKILLIDEVHALSRTLAEDLYNVIDNNVVSVPTPVSNVRGHKTIFALRRSEIPEDMQWNGPDTYRVPIHVGRAEWINVDHPITGITIIGATTDEAMLPPAFLRRLSSLKVYLREYTLPELGTIATLHADDLGMRVHPQAMIYLAVRSRSNPARIKQLVERTADFATRGVVTVKAASKACEALGVDALGLEPPHRAVLEALAAGPMSRTSLGQRLGIPATNLSLYFGDLLRLGLVNISTRHEITPLGMQAIAA